MTDISVLLVEDHNLVREGLRLLLEEHGGFEVCGQAVDGSEAVLLAEKLRPDVVVMDISMPKLNGLEATSRMRMLAHPPRIIILSQHSRAEYVVQALRTGASAYLLKDAVMDELTGAIHAVIAGNRYLSRQLPEDMVDRWLEEAPSDETPLDLLTAREREVLQLVAEGNTNRQIATHLSISVKTVEKHRFNLMEKLQIRDVTGLVRFAIEQGIIQVDEGVE